MRIKQLLLSCAIAGVLASGLLPEASNVALAQFVCGPNDTICVPAFGWCEPVTTPAARAMCPLRRGGGGGGAPRKRSGGGGGAPKTGTSAIEPGAFQIKPLSCPRGFVQMGETFYGGTKCGTPAQAADVFPRAFPLATQLRQAQQAQQQAGQAARQALQQQPQPQPTQPQTQPQQQPQQTQPQQSQAQQSQAQQPQDSREGCRPGQQLCFGIPDLDRMLAKMLDKAEADSAARAKESSEHLARMHEWFLNNPRPGH
jgi:hypothetical protein